jgi:hypothetical protein
MKGGLRIQDVLRTAREALHRNKILAADDAKVHAHERNFYGPGEDRRIHAAQAAEKIDVIVMAVAQDEHLWNGVVGVSMTQFGVKACALKSRAQLGQVLRRREEKNIYVG